MSSNNSTWRVRFFNDSIWPNILLEIKKSVNYEQKKLVTVDKIFDRVYDALVGSIQKELLIEKSRGGIDFSGGSAYFTDYSKQKEDINILEDKEGVKSIFMNYYLKEMTIGAFIK